MILTLNVEVGEWELEAMKGTKWAGNQLINIPYLR